MYAAITIDTEPDFPSKEYAGIKELDNFLDKFNEPFTLFITPDIFQNFPDLVEKWSKRHEIGLHIHPGYLGYEEDDYLNYYSKEKQKEIIKKGIEIVKETYDINKLKSFRTGRWAYSSYLPEFLEEFGFTYDSSLYPTVENNPKLIGNITEVSPTVWRPFPLWLLYKLHFLEFGGIGLTEGPFKRGYGFMLYFTAYRLFYLKYFVFAFHPYDLLDVNLKNNIEKYINFLLSKRRAIKMSEIEI